MCELLGHTKGKATFASLHRHQLCSPLWSSQSSYFYGPWLPGNEMRVWVPSWLGMAAAPRLLASMWDTERLCKLRTEGCKWKFLMLQPLPRENGSSPTQTVLGHPQRAHDMSPDILHWSIINKIRTKNNASTLFLGANVIKPQGQHLHVTFFLEDQGSENVAHCPPPFHLSPLSLPPE